MKRISILAAVLLIVVALMMGCQQGIAPAPKPTATPVPTPISVFEPTSSFAKGAFPQTIPDRAWHAQAWLITDCLACHGKDTPGEAPKVVHKDLPELYLSVNCRTCHVPVSEAPTPKK